MSIRFTALTVREGDAFLLEDDGWTCLFDSGVDESIIDLLEFKGIDKLDLAICSHNDEDHTNGFIALFEFGFQINEIWLPGIWANVLQFVKEHCVDGKDVEWGSESNDGELDPLFSEESVDEESFNQSLTLIEELRNSKKIDEFSDLIHGKLARYIIEKPDIIADLLYRDLKAHFNEDSKAEHVADYLDEVMWDSSLCYFYPRRIIKLWAHRIAHDWPKFINDKRFIREFLSHGWVGPEITQNEIKRSLDFKLENIVRIATLAKQNGCTIRWFEPSTACRAERIDYGFISLNSRKMCSIGIPKGSLAYMYLLYLTKENRYSLVFEYTKKGTPVIRFSADSNSTCQSVPSYQNNIIVTAPHHGSSANAKVYNAIQGDDLVWVRSDCQSKKRPCTEFKNRNNKYCLACRKHNFISEICFDYNPGLKQWDYVRGERCRCK